MYFSTKLDKQALAQKLSIVSFFILIPFFIVYNILISNNFIPPIFGGYFGLFCAIGLIFFSPFLLTTFKKSIQANPLFSFINFSAFALVLIITAMAYFEHSMPASVTQSASTLLFWATLYTIGFYFIQSAGTKSTRIGLVVLIILFLYFSWYVATTGNLTFRASADLDIEEDKLSSYQNIARNFLLFSCFLFAFEKNRIIQLFIFAISLFCLFVVGARSELVAFVGAFATLNIILSFRQKFYFIVSAVFFTSMILLYLVFEAYFGDSRQFQILNFENSSSWNARLDYQDIAILQITQNPILGWFGGHEYATGSTGGFAHNALSAYVNYGLIFFIFYIGMNFTSFSISFLKILGRPFDSAWVYAFLINFCSFFLILVAKPVFWILPFFAWALTLGALYKDKTKTAKAATPL